MLQAGGHEYPFQYALPHHVPTSFESEDIQFKGSQGKITFVHCYVLCSIVEVMHFKVFVVLAISKIKQRI